MKKLVWPLALTILASCNPDLNKYNHSKNKINWPNEVVDIKEVELDYEINHLLHVKPWLTLWSEVYKQSEDNIIFFNRAGKGFDIAQVIDKVPRNDFKISDDSFFKPFSSNLSGNIARKATTMTTRANDEGFDITWNNGRFETFTKNFENYKEIIPYLANIYEFHNLPRSLVAHLITESFLNPYANSGHATGIAQITHRNNSFFRGFLRQNAGFEYNHRDFITQSALSAAMLNIAVKRNDGSYLAALTDYHAGLVNTDRLKIVGGVELSDFFENTSTLENYVEGLLVAHNLRNHPDYGSVFFSARRDTRNYAGNVASLVPLVRAEDLVCKESINRYVVTSDLDNVILRSGMSQDEFLKYNPHINLNQNKITNTPVNIFNNFDVLGKDNFWEKESNIWDKWNQFNIKNADSLDHYKNLFLEEGVWSMAAAIELYRQTMDAYNTGELNVRGRRVKITDHLYDLKTNHPWKYMLNE